MRRNIFLLVFLLLASLCFAAEQTKPMELVFFYGDGCPHCARMEPVVDDSLKTTFAADNISLVKKEIYYDAVSRQEMLNLFVRFGKDPQEAGIPTTLVDNRSLIIGEVTKARFEQIISEHLKNSTLTAIYTEDSFTPANNVKPNEGKELTIIGVILAGLGDAINPCTIAIMVMLLSTILVSEGKKKMALAAATFIIVIFLVYVLVGLGIYRIVSDASLTHIFYIVMTGLTFIMAAMQINAYFNYRPGFSSFEMPMFVRPYAKKVIEKATTIPGVAAAALFCSFFLLPCSSGPYLAILSMLSKANMEAQAVFYILLYNLFFILPMTVIAIAIFLGKTTVERVGAMREMYIKEIHLFSGLLFLFLFLLMLTQVLNIRLF
ncbi:MAG: hypothetical protein V1492_00495 [Candidatus Micrarchaeota archaeon]